MPLTAPEKPINKETFEALMCFPFVTLEGIADFFKCNKQTIQRWVKRQYNCTFDTLKAKKWEGMKTKLLGKQLDMALKGNIQMLVHLGKNYLDQTEKIEQKIDVKVTEFKIGWADETDTPKKN
jgi:hypothetical protein